MKFRIRYADKIVGALVVIALLFLVLVIFLLGSKQRWFEKKYSYTALLDSASGISQNMPVLYKGFTIGNVDSLELNGDDLVEIQFHVLEGYHDRVREGSLVEIIVSPIGLGNQFYFYAGLGEELVEGSVIPSIDSYEGRQLMARGLSQVAHGEDNISSLIIRANNFLEGINVLLAEAGDALMGTDTTSLGRIIGNVEHVSASLNDSLAVLLEDTEKLLSDFTVISGELSSPGGTLLSILDAEGSVYRDLEKTIHSLSGTLDNLEKTTVLLPAQVPNIAGLIEDLRVTVNSAEDVLESLKNNPLLKKGFSDKAAAESGGTSPRDISF